jgi:hypothetical protein
MAVVAMRPRPAIVEKCIVLDIVVEIEFSKVKVLKPKSIGASCQGVTEKGMDRSVKDL